MEPVLKTVKLKKDIGKRNIVSDISLELSAGEVFGFLGPNGAGKTTTIRMIVGLSKITEGDIFVSGSSVRTDFCSAMSQVGCIVENPEMYKYMSGLDNLKLFAKLYDGITRERIDEVVKVVDLEHAIKDKVKTYSLGMKQRLGIAQALLHKPKLLILDEPTNGLDPAGIKAMRELLRTLAATEGLTVFVSSHILSEMQQMCDRVGIINHGRMVTVKTVDELINMTQDEGKTVLLLRTGDNVKASELLSAAGISTNPEADGIHVETQKDKVPEIVTTLAGSGHSGLRYGCAGHADTRGCLYETDRGGKTVMGKFLKLVSVENTKLWKRLSTKIMILILIAVVVGVGGLLKAEQSIIEKTLPQSNYSNDWKQQLAAQDTQLQTNINSMEKSSSRFQKAGMDAAKMQLAENKYEINNNIKPESSGKQDYWDIIMEGNWESIIALFAIIACTALVAGEFSEGTMKTMISRPFKRWQILTSKLIVILIYTIMLTAITYLVIMAADAVMFGTSGFNAMKLLWFNGNVLYLPGGVVYLIHIGLNFLHILVFVIIAFMLSAIFRSRSLATGMSIFLTFLGSLATLLGVYFSWGKFILFADTDFTSFLSGAPFYEVTLCFALIVSAVYCAVFLFAGYFTFAKRDIS